MNVNGVAKNIANAHGQLNAKNNRIKSVKSDGSKGHDNGVVYELSKRNEKSQKYKPDARVIAHMKAETAARKEQLLELVRKTLGGQANAWNKANSIWDMLRTEKFTVDAATREQVLGDIGEGGYWGVAQTSGRILDFARTFAGDDLDKLAEMEEAFEKGYKMAENTWGGKLPALCQQTRDSVLGGFQKIREEISQAVGVSDSLPSAGSSDAVITVGTPNASSYAYNFARGSLEEELFQHLKGKNTDGSFAPEVAAAMLGNMLQGAEQRLIGTVEERAVVRETAVRNAEYIAQNYFDDSDEAKAFMDVVRKAADNDILREKGYNPYDSSWRPYITPISPDGGIYNAFVEKHTGISGARGEVFDNTHPLWEEVNAAFVEAYWKDQGKTLFAEAEKDFYDNARQVEDRINVAISQMPDKTADNNFLDIIRILQPSDIPVILEYDAKSNDTGMSWFYRIISEGKLNSSAD